MKLVILTSHPIQYQAPFFGELASLPGMDLRVLFARNSKAYDKEFARNVRWDVPLLEGYNHHFLKNRFEVSKILKETKPSALLVYGWNSFVSWFSIFKARKNEVSVFLVGENPLNQELMKPKWKIRIKKIILGKLFKQVSAFLCIGEENKKFYQFYGVPENKLFLAPYAVDNNRFIGEAKNLNPRTQNLRESMGIDAGDVVILFVGKLIEKKRPMDLLRAYESMLKTSDAKKSTLLFVGDGALRSELENYAKEHDIKNVIFAGFKNQTELPRYYAVADFFVLPSGVGETWGLVVNEAMCFGLPIIVSNMVGCGPDLVRNNQNGFIFTLGDVQALASHLKELVDDDQKRKSFGKKSLEIIENHSYKEDAGAVLRALNYVKKP